ncbi:hypothetical protein [Bacillus sp. FJAT-47783]|uniref:hypothetical protein n=1 Tax=Bacillus sp. FJAT-47783 TaxID=2922712 RepID=UPI001FAD053F|nr:hypothetical protein [Bacillus sp. FJAT-47783]
MVRIKWKYILILLVVLIIIVSIRIKAVNENRHFYETYRKNVQAGDTITLGDLELTFGQAGPPLIKESDHFPNEKIAVFKLPIEVTKKSDRPLEMQNKFGIYENYRDYKSLALVDYTNKQNNQDFYSSISSLKKDETVSLTISTDFILGDFYYYYNDYNVDKPAYIVIAGPQSPKGIPLYYYELQEKT